MSITQHPSQSPVDPGQDIAVPPPATPEPGSPPGTATDNALAGGQPDLAAAVFLQRARRRSRARLRRGLIRVLRRRRIAQRGSLDLLLAEDHHIGASRDPARPPTGKPWSGRPARPARTATWPGRSAAWTGRPGASTGCGPGRPGSSSAPATASTTWSATQTAGTRQWRTFSGTRPPSAPRSRTRWREAHASTSACRGGSAMSPSWSWWSTSACCCTSSPGLPTSTGPARYR